MSLEEKVKISILQNPDFKIKEVKSLEIFFVYGDYYKHKPILEAILEKGEYEKLNQIDSAENAFDDITVFQFVDNSDKKYYGLFYDSFELWQDPVVTHIYPIVSASM